MAGKPFYDIRELPPYQHTVAGQQYRGYLYHCSQTAIWISNVYFALRLGLLIYEPQWTWQMWLMVFVEWIFARLSRHDQALTVLSGKGANATARKRLRLAGSTNELPLVDVFVPCCGEPLDVILDTVCATCTLDYPTSRFRVLVLDDGGSSALHDVVSELQLKWPHLHYHTRGHHSGRVFAKAGNLNYALFNLQEEFQPEYCAIFDADCLPTPDFLRATLPHLLQNQDAVLLTTRQYYYNLPARDPLCQSRIYFYACHNTELDIRKAAIDAGSGAVFRRKPIIDLGGYPTYSFSEDWQLSLLLQGLGYQTLQLEEMLQLGLVPASLEGYIRQRDRWNLGHAQQVRALSSAANQAIPRGLRWSIALNGIVIILGLVGNFIGFLAAPLLLLSGPVIPTTSTYLVKIQLVLAVAHMAMTWMHEWLQVTHTDFRVSLFAHLENSWLSGIHLFAILRFHLVSANPKGSFVTGSSANTWNHAFTTSSLYKKCLHDLCGSGIIFPVLLFMATIGSTLFSVVVGVSQIISKPGFLSGVLVSAAWPPLLHVCYLAVSSLWVPVAYLLERPRYPERKERMEKTEKGVMFPMVAVQEEVVRYKPGASRVVFFVPIVLGAVLGAAMWL